MKRKLPKVISRDQTRKLLGAVNFSTPTGLRNRVAMELMYRCGLRVSEVCNLRRTHIHWDDGKLLIESGKGGKDRFVPMEAATIEWMREWDQKRYGRAKSFFHTTKGTVKSDKHSQLSPRTLQAAVTRYADLAGLGELRITPHVLRHTYATECHQEGASPLQLRKLLGHSDVSTTMIYTHISDPELEEFIRGRGDQQSLEHQPTAQDRALLALLAEVPEERKRAILEGVMGEE